MQVPDNINVTSVPEQELVGTKSLILDRFPVPIHKWEPDRRLDLTNGKTRPVLNREGWKVGKSAVKRIYCEAGLTLPLRRKGRLRESQCLNWYRIAGQS
jgi:hypothetical protein